MDNNNQWNMNLFKVVQKMHAKLSTDINIPKPPFAIEEQKTKRRKHQQREDLQSKLGIGSSRIFTNRGTYVHTNVSASLKSFVQPNLRGSTCSNTNTYIHSSSV